MTSNIVLRANRKATIGNADIVLDTESPKATAEINFADFEDRLGPLPPLSRDLLYLGCGVYCSDKLVRRRDGVDGWSRDIRLTIPASRSAWKASSSEFERALRFLSQDDWTLRFRHNPGTPEEPALLQQYDTVCLFSGGLDSLIGAIDLLEGDSRRRVLLVGHHEAPGIKTLQDTLVSTLVDVYKSRVGFLPIFVRPTQRTGAEYPLPSKRENTTRTRSFTFIMGGLAAASALGDRIPLYVPENGFIAINVPMGEDRLGSCSTRTTHPYFIYLLANALTSVGIVNPIRNPYVYQTKGEMIEECLNQRILSRIARLSVSCSHPEQGRFSGKPSKPNCGYCYPCIIRRASFHHVGADDARDYRRDVCRDPNLVFQERSGADARAVLHSFSEGSSRLAIYRQGPIPDGVSADRLASMYQRGREEIRRLFSDKAVKNIRDYAGL